MESPPRGPWWQAILDHLLSVPGGISIIFALVLLGMFMGFFPSTLSNTINAIQQDMISLHKEHAELRQSIQALSDANNNNLALQTRLLRGICIIMSKNQTDQLNYCNP